MFYQAKIEAFGREIEVFYKKSDENFEVWVMSEEALLNHYVSSVNPESGISFVNASPMKWMEVLGIPSSIGAGGSTSRIKSNRACFDPIYEAKLDRKAWNKSKKQIAGTWQDQEISFTLSSDNKFLINTPVPDGHFLSNILRLKPKFWDYRYWHLSIGGDSGGLRFPTLGCIGGDKLAIKLQGNGPIAHVFTKG
jgi:hypothetical protein